MKLLRVIQLPANSCSLFTCGHRTHANFLREDKPILQGKKHTGDHSQVLVPITHACSFRNLWLCLVHMVVRESLGTNFHTL